jgi:hypothetical protein
MHIRCERSIVLEGSEAEEQLARRIGQRGAVNNDLSELERVERIEVRIRNVEREGKGNNL